MIDSFGPLVAGSQVYDDFYIWRGPEPYRETSVSCIGAGHLFLIVGYDDEGY